MIRLCTAVGLCLLACWASPAIAQNYPDRPVTIVVPYDPGGLPDLVARIIASKMHDALRQSVVVRNKPGAASMIGTTEVARSVPDGYTLLINGPALAVLPSLFKTVTYNAEHDLTPITRLVDSPYVMYAAPSLGVSNLSEFLKKYKKDASLSYGTPGVGTGPHLAAEVFKARLGLDIQHVPYKSGPEVFNDLIAGRVQITFNGAQFRGFIDSGKVKALAVAAAKRMELLPELPTFAELGYPMPEIASGSWYGLFAPAGTPEAIITKLNQVVVDALTDETIRRQLISQGFIPVGSSPHDTEVFLHEEIERWPPILARAGIAAQ
jgi:tripartite-type tricarboxylate transporter receptor subunit TctC